MEHHWKFLGGGGVLTAKFLDEMYENKLEFSWGEKGGGGGVHIFNMTALFLDSKYANQSVFRCESSTFNSCVSSKGVHKHKVTKLGSHTCT